VQPRQNPWNVVLPNAWPEAPCEMSVSVLGEIEACPRRWALASADFPDLWQQRGYPPRLQLSGLAGTVVHMAAEDATRALVRGGCQSPHAPEAVAVMRELGGYSVLLNRCIDRVLASHRSNPRTVHVMEMIARTLASQIPDMRAHLQGLMGRVRLSGARIGARDGERGQDEKARRPLTPGVYPELDVRVPQIGWRGKIDVLTISEANCEITDFKTGAPQAHHASQVRTYAVLWKRDKELNPTERVANRLTISYRSETVAVDAPSVIELDALADEMVERARLARRAVTDRVPEARPGAETCRYCSVRHMCEEYWTAAAQRKIAEGSVGPSQFTDMELSITGRHGPTSWDGIVGVSRVCGDGRHVVLRTESSGPNLKRDDHVRILDAHVVVPEEETEPAVATLTALSELFLVNRS
jgi:hypothetical protein